MSAYSSASIITKPCMQNGAVDKTSCKCILQHIHIHTCMHIHTMLQGMQSAPRATLTALHDVMCKKHKEQRVMGMYNSKGWQSSLTHLARTKTSSKTASSMKVRLPVVMRNDRDWLSNPALKKRATPRMPAMMRGTDSRSDVSR